MIAHEGKVFFTEAELRCKGSGQLILAEGFAEKLLTLRLVFNQPMKVSSGCRSKSHNIKVKGAKDSFHICDDERGGCRAVDVLTPNPSYRTALIELALSLGWSVGVNKSFIHLDRRVDLGYPKVIFTY